MLVRVRHRKGDVGRCTVVKAARQREDGDRDVVLRLVFDQREDNAQWAEPPWIGLVGPSTLAAIDLSE